MAKAHTPVPRWKRFGRGPLRREQSEVRPRGPMDEILQRAAPGRMPSMGWCLRASPSASQRNLLFRCGLTLAAPVVPIGRKPRTSAQTDRPAQCRSHVGLQGRYGDTERHSPVKDQELKKKCDLSRFRTGVRCLGSAVMRSRPVKEQYVIPSGVLEANARAGGCAACSMSTPGGARWVGESFRWRAETAFGPASF